MADEMKIGSVVQLKSGGPKMTVASIDGDSCMCGWFIGDEFVDESFVTLTLNIIIENKIRQ